MFDAAHTGGATHILVHTYEFQRRERRVTGLIELISLPDLSVLYTIDETFAVSRVAAAIDRHLPELVPALGVPFTELDERIIRRTLLVGSHRELERLGQLIETARSGDDLSRTLDRFLRFISDEPRLMLAHLEAGQLAARAQRHQESANILFNVITNHGLSWPSLYVDACRGFRKSSLPNMAQRTLVFAREAGWDTPLLRTEQARVYEAASDHASALTAYRDVLTHLPHNGHALHYLARDYNDRGVPDSALLFSDRLEQTEGFKGEAALERGRARLALGDTTGALKDLEQSAALLPGDHQSHLILARLLDSKGDHAAAAQSWKRALEGMPNDATVLLGAVNAYRQAREPKLALSLLKEKAARFYTSRRITAEIGLLELELGDTAAARPHLERTLNLDPPDVRVLAAMGGIYHSAGETGRALSLLEQAVAIAPDNHTARMLLGELYIQKGRSDDAEKMLAPLYDADPPVRGLYALRGDIAFARGTTKEAYTYYQRERDLYEGSLHVQKRIAFIAFTQHDLEQAHAETQRLIAHAPSDPSGYFQQALIAMRTSRISEASAFLSQGELLGVPDSGVYFELAAGFGRAGAWDRAIDAWKKGLRDYPAHRAALEGLANAYLKNGNDTLAAHTWVTLYETDPGANAPFLARAGHRYFEHGDKEKALHAYLRFLDDGHSDNAVRLGAARIAFDRKEYQKVIDLIEPLNPTASSEITTVRMAAFSYAGVQKFPQARPLATQLALRLPKDQDVALLAALCHEAAGDLRGATAMYERYLGLGTTDVSANHAFTLARLYEQQKRPDHAIARYRANIRDYPGDFRNYQHLSQLHRDAGRLSAAAQVLESAAGMDSVPAPLLLSRARLEVRRGRNEPALASYTAYLRANPADSTAWHELATLYRDSKRPVDAVGPLQEAIRLMPQRTGLYVELGSVYLQLDSLSPAAVTLRSAHSLDPENRQIAQMVHQAVEKLGDTAALVAIVEARTHLEPDNATLVANLAELYLATGKTDAGITMLENAVRLSPSDSALRRTLVRLYRAKGDRTAQQLHLEAALRIAPKDAALHFEQGLLSLEKHEHEPAAAAFRRAIELRPAFHEAQYRYGLLLRDRGEHQQAAAVFRAATRHHPGSVDYLREYARASLHAADLTNAASAIDKALGLAPDDPGLLTQGGVIHARKGNSTRADSLLNRALRHDRTCRLCHEELGRIAYMNGENSRAIDHLSQALGREQSDDTLLVLLGNAQLREGNLRSAASSFNRALSVNPHNNEALYRVCATMVDQGQVARAAALLENNKERTPSGWMLLARARVLEAQDNTPAAVISYRAVLELMPGNPDAATGLGRSFLAQSQFEHAAAHFSTALEHDPANVEALTGRGEARAAQGKHDLAVNDLMRGAGIDPRHPRAYLLAGKSYNALGRSTDAVGALRRAVVYHERSAPVHFELARALEGALLYTEALSHYERAARLDAQTYGAKGWRAAGDLAREKLSDTRNAKRYYTRYLNAGGDDPAIREMLKSL